MSRIPLWRLAALLVLLPLLAGGCGVGSVKESTFVYDAMGPEGGTVSTEEVTLVVPAGALAGPTTIGILPETNALPIQPPLQDPCTYAVLGPQYCCGPVGLALLQDGRLAVTYDETLIPDGVDEDDLALLLWDEGLGALVPYDAAVHDAAADRFEVDAYDVLGHLAVGYRTCPQPGIVFLGINPAQFARIDDAPPTAVVVEDPSGLWLVAADGSIEAAPLPTDSVIPDSFLPSPDGRTVMYEELDTSGQRFTSLLYSVAATDGVPTLLAGDDELIDAYGPTFGWMRDGSRVFFQERIEASPGLTAQVITETSFSTVPGDGSADPSSLYPVGPFAYVDDVRQSLDGNLVMVAYFGQFENLVVDVFESATGDEVSRDVIPYGGGHGSPRFLPDSSGLYLVDSDGESVDRYDPDGTNPADLFTPPAEHGFLKDFVLAPNGDDYAYVATAVEDDDTLYLGSLSGGLRTSVDLGTNAFYDEMFFHPDGNHVFLDTYQSDVLMVRASDGVFGPSLGLQDLEGLDISADDGRLLLAIGSFRDLALRVDPTARQLAPGLYVADPDGQNQQPVTTPASLNVLAARWLRTVRRAPCMNGSSCFR